MQPRAVQTKTAVNYCRGQFKDGRITVIDIIKISYFGGRGEVGELPYICKGQRCLSEIEEAPRSYFVGLAPTIATTYVAGTLTMFWFTEWWLTFCKEMFFPNC